MTPGKRLTKVCLKKGYHTSSGIGTHALRRQSVRQGAADHWTTLEGPVYTTGVYRGFRMPEGDQRVDDEARQRMRALALPQIEAGDPTGWFERLYSAAAGDPAAIPWADLQPTPGVVSWSQREHLDGAGRSALVVGCGLGDDAAYLAGCGFRVTGFDISESAVAWCRKRYAGMPIVFEVGDLFAPFRGWISGFDFVLEVNTLQALPPEVRGRAVRPLGSLVAPGGRLLVLARGRDTTDPEGELPWPLTRDELDPLVRDGLLEESFEDYLDDEEPPVRRFRVTYLRPR